MFDTRFLFHLLNLTPEKTFMWIFFSPELICVFWEEFIKIRGCKIYKRTKHWAAVPNGNKWTVSSCRASSSFSPELHQSPEFVFVCVCVWSTGGGAQHPIHLNLSLLDNSERLRLHTRPPHTLLHSLTFSVSVGRQDLEAVMSQEHELRLGPGVLLKWLHEIRVYSIISSSEVIAWQCLIWAQTFLVLRRGGTMSCCHSNNYSLYII